MRPIVDGQNVLFLGRDNFVSWELIGSEVYAPITNHYDVEETPSLYRATDLNAKFDWDNVPPHGTNLDAYDTSRFDWVMTTSAAHAERGATRRSRLVCGPTTSSCGTATAQSDSAAPCSSRSTPAHRSTAAIPARRSSARSTAPRPSSLSQPVVGRVWSPSPELDQSKPGHAVDST